MSKIRVLAQSSDSARSAAQRSRGKVAPPPSATLAVQRDASGAPSNANKSSADVHAEARRGTAGAGGPLPYFDTIQRLFGRHSVAHVVAHTDRQAGTAAQAIGAEAFTLGNHVAFAGAPTLRTTAHEAAHTVQQQSGVHLSGGVGVAGDPYERHADEVADAVSAGRTAEGILDRFAAPRSTSYLQARAAVQRKVVIGGKVAKVSDDEKTHSADSDTVRLSETTGALGADERNIKAMTLDLFTRYFLDETELKNYAAHKTEDIGYVDRQKTWVRLPEYLVLGEDHSATTLPDLIAATENQHWRYEGEEQKSSYLYPKTKPPQNDHAIEQMLPKIVVGLVGIKGKLDQALAEAHAFINKHYFGRSGRKEEYKRAVDHKAQVSAQAFVSQEEQDKKYEKDLEAWSLDWEEKAAKDMDGRKGMHKDYGNGMFSPAPARAYQRENVEIKYTLKALKSLQDSELLGSHPLKDFYLNNAEVINATVKQLDAGTSVEYTSMFKKMVTGKFDFDEMINQFKAAAQAEFKKSGAVDIAENPLYKPQYETAAAGHDMEALRDAYMLDSILKGKQSGIRLFGIGDRHRKNLAPLIKKNDSEITVQEYGAFYRAQYDKHPDVK